MLKRRLRLPGNADDQAPQFEQFFLTRNTIGNPQGALSLYATSWASLHPGNIGGKSGKNKLSLSEALDLLQNLPSEISDALTDDFSDGEVPANNLLEFSLDS
ncbi:hypothetical protein TNCV_1623311 [Trichonephila clavipes]|nr:hypothetical protein TNCV_1623311 [Trichonephila clavipes]